MNRSAEREICDPLSRELLRTAHRHLQAHMSQATAAKTAGDRAAEQIAVCSARALGEFLNEAMALVRAQDALGRIADGARGGMAS
jgi:uncharacterized protein YaaW (UPF0174 family)